jgi:ABC-type transport system substrate-binding protein
MTQREREPALTRRTVVLGSLSAIAVSVLAACAAPAPAPTAPPPAAAVKPTVQPAAAAGPTNQPAAAAKPTAAPSKPAAARAPIPLVKAGLSTNILSLDPAVSPNAPSYQTSVLTAGQLYRFNFDKQPQPDLAEKSDVSSDGKTITTTLKAGLVYSDGSPLPASDVVYAYQRQVKGAGANFVAPIESVEATDARTVLWKLKAPYPDFLSVLALHVILVHPKDKIEADKDAYFNKPVSAGPYAVAEWVPGTPKMMLAANPKYVGGEVMVKQIELNAVADLTSRVLQLSTGQLDWAFDLPASARDSFPSEVSVAPHPLGGIYHVTVNLDKSGPLQDARVRQAMSLAIDRDAVNQKAFFGISKPADAFMYSGTPEYSPALPNGGKRDVEAARQLLATTPYASGFSFEFQTWSARAGWKEAALTIADHLKDIGINAAVNPVEDAVIIANSKSGAFEAMWTGTVQLPVFQMSLMFVPGGSWCDAARYKNPDVAGLIQKAATELDTGKRRQLLADAQKLIYQDMPHIPISERAVLSGTRVPGNVLDSVQRAEYIRVKTVAEMV